jgi:hypothetical protein
VYNFFQMIINHKSFLLSLKLNHKSVSHFLICLNLKLFLMDLLTSLIIPLLAHNNFMKLVSVENLLLGDSKHSMEVGLSKKNFQKSSVSQMYYFINGYLHQNYLLQLVLRFISAKKVKYFKQ